MSVLKKNLIIHFVIISALISYVLIINYFNISCPIRAITNIPCPTCGMTRAFISLIKLDFIKSFYYHPLLILVFPLVFFGIHKNTRMLKFMKPTLINAILYTGGILFFVVYFIRLYFQFFS